VEELAEATESVAAGRYDVEVPDANFSVEFHQLSQSFTNMAGRLAATDIARSRFLADLTHELRTPLATLEVYIDGLEDDVVPHDAKSYATMRDQVDRLRRLSLDLRDASAAEEHALNLDLEELDARSVAAASVAAASPRYQAKGVELEWDDFGQPCRIVGDRVRLQQVLGNLLDNALRHTPAGGRPSGQGADHRHRHGRRHAPVGTQRSIRPVSPHRSLTCHDRWQWQRARPDHRPRDHRGSRWDA
jgi:two-component system sensor histidine kinase BaeS